MPTGFGIDHSTNTSGTLTGTSSQDIRKVFGGLYTEGIISGADVKTTTGLTYTIDPGLVNLWYSGSSTAKETVMLPVPSATVATTAGPSSGTRTDYVWVRQNPPGTDTNTGSQITWGVSPTNPRTSSNVPGQYFILDTFTVPAGMTATNSATRTGSRAYSVPYGSSSLLLKMVDTHDGRLYTAAGKLRTLSGKLTLPVDTQVRFTCGVTLEHDGMQSTVDDGINAALHINGIREVWWSTGEVTKYPETKEWSVITTLPAGTHTIEWRRSEIKDTAKIRLRYQNKGIPGSYVYAEAVGVG